MQRTLIVLGLVLLILGLAWPWLGKLGHLPGDVSFGGDGWRVTLPITTSILISAVLSLILWLLNR